MVVDITLVVTKVFDEVETWAELLGVVANVSIVVLGDVVEAEA